MAEIVWTEQSLSDLESIYDYIARDSPHYARHQIENIFRNAERLRQFPESGRHLPEFPNIAHREVIVGSYRLIYRFDSEKDQLIVITVVHGKRLLNSPTKK